MPGGALSRRMLPALALVLLIEFSRCTGVTTAGLAGQDLGGLSKSTVYGRKLRPVGQTSGQSDSQCLFVRHLAVRDSWQSEEAVAVMEGNLQGHMEVGHGGRPVGVDARSR